MEGKHWIVGIVIVLFLLFIGIVFDTGSGYRPKCDSIGIGSRPDC